MIFWIIVASLIVMAIFWITPSLLTKHDLRGLDRKQQNINIAKERLDEIAAEHASGAMTDELYDSTKTELEASLLDDMAQQEEETTLSESNSKKFGLSVLVVLVVLIPLSTLGLYQLLGSPDSLEYVGANAGRQPNIESLSKTAASMEDLLVKLKKRLEKNPKDGEGWFLMSKIYMAEKRYGDAVDALNKTLVIYGDQPAILLGLADATAMMRGGDLTGKPSEYITRALKMEPDNMTGLWLGGMSAHQQGQFQLAVDRWIQVLPQLASEPESQKEIKSLILEATRQAKEMGIDVVVKEVSDLSVDKAVSGKSIAVTVSLEDSLKANVKADDTVFVFAKAASGPPMPLAAYKTTVAELPLDIVLDDSMAMMPQMKLSAFDEVIVSARVSMKGQPVAQAGDFSSDQVKLSLVSKAKVMLSIKHSVTDPKAIPVVQLSMAQSQDKGQEKAQDTTGPAIKAWVSLSKEMMDKASADDVVFVFAKATQGPPMPLAAFKTTVSALPMEVTLDDSMAMMPQMKLSSFPEVSVSARVAKSGSPRAMPGDLSSEATILKVGGVVGVELSISEVVQ